MKIINIKALQILDSRGNPTLKVEVYLEDGSKGAFEVPSGASTGIHEVHELRDGNIEFFQGKSVLKAINNIHEITSEIIGKDFTQESLDNMLIELDGTPDKSNMGANAILGISIAFAKASSKYYNLPLYEYLQRLVNGVSFTNKNSFKLSNIHLFANVINGGLHSGNELNIQEFMIVPVLDNINEDIRAISEIYHELKKIIEEKYGKSNTAVGDEGGFAPNIIKPSDALDLLIRAISTCGYEGKVFMALDAAASDFYDSQLKLYEVEKDLLLDYKKLTDYYIDLADRYPIISIEDSMAEDDFEGFAYFMKKFAKRKTQNPLILKNENLSVGDDLLVTNPLRIKMAISKKLCNSLLLKINQIGTLSESIEAFKLANSKGWHTIVSHRSGETIDSFIADLAVALNSSIKIGAPARGERVAKYNRLLDIYK